MPSDSFELVTLKSGQISLRLLSNRETFHPVIGPEAEARILHVDQQKLVERSRGLHPFIIWDVGLGAAANAIAALDAILQNDATSSGRVERNQGQPDFDSKAPGDGSSSGRVELHSFDHTLAPLIFACENSEHLRYIQPYRRAVDELMRRGFVRLGRVDWFLHVADFRTSLARSDLPAPHSILYDPYSAVSNLEMWTLEHFTRLRQVLDPGRPCLLTNYTKSTAIRSTWLLAGFFVGIGVGIGDKDQTSLASSHRHLLDRPLSTEWLKKVPASQNANPLREAGRKYAPMNEADFIQLCEHPQFQ